MKTIKINKKILSKNEEKATEIRAYLNEKKVRMLNLVGSPGAGKTTILEKIIEKFDNTRKIVVIEGDLYTTRDAERLKKYEIQVVQINTMGACHLEAGMVWQALKEVNLEEIDFLIIENVGNLVCTASYDLGENIRATVLSVPEGNDKLLKYPVIFQRADLIIINKIDLLPYTDFSLEEIEKDLKQINKNAPVFKLSGKTGAGLDKLCFFLEENLT
ncbi:hydrogenase nickel incorporation protein HypB [Halothermothrix orenii]|uniref:Hydrogenase accessory protein HypB n=1 Tax=Halothermothrix orenii (strain H 168 / OCM 544 / DSM 9562) TaxID=373903 RepID=B8D1S0_HALOH|nr:hydrogenase nickel incorporation protein HypB [Halothermothrix orenii]ACL69147.1 hydrogenase accessory protein HypB [Halothermothrix orenii H 168]